MLVCDMEKYKRPPLQQEPNVYLEPKWLRGPQCCSGLELTGPAHEELETPEAVLGAGIEARSYLAQQRKSSRPPTQAPRQAEAGRGRPRQASRQASREVLREASRQVSRQASRRASRHREANPPKPSKPPSKPSKPSKTLQTLQTPSQTGTPGPRPLLNQAPRAKGHSNGFLLAFKAAVCQPANTPNAPKPSKHSKHHPKPPNPPGLEACF